MSEILDKQINIDFEGKEVEKREKEKVKFQTTDEGTVFHDLIKGDRCQRCEDGSCVECKFRLGKEERETELTK